MKTLVILLFSLAAFAEVHERRVVVDKISYLVKYDVPPCNLRTGEHCTSFVPLTMPPGQVHYDARISVLSEDGKQIGQSFDGQWTQNGCFEDNPETLTRYALKHKDDPRAITGNLKLGEPGSASGFITCCDGQGFTATDLTTTVIYDPERCYGKQISIDPVQAGETMEGLELVVIKARVCKDGKWVSAKVVVE